MELNEILKGFIVYLTLGHFNNICGFKCQGGLYSKAKPTIFLLQACFKMSVANIFFQITSYIVLTCSLALTKHDLLFQVGVSFILM